MMLNETIDQSCDMDMISVNKTNVIDTDNWSDIQGSMLAEDNGHLSEHALADAYHALYSADVALNPHFDDWYADAAQQWWSDFFSTIGPAVRDMTINNPTLTERLAINVANKLQQYLRNCDSSSGTEEESVSDELRRIKSMQEARDAMQEDLDEARDLQELRLDSQEFKATYEKTRKNGRAKAILQLAGQMLRFAYGQRKERAAGIDRAGGLEFAGDLSRLVAQEYVNLGDPMLELDFLRRFVESETLNIRRFREDPIGRGPVVFICDESGSMDGDRIIQAKALAAAMAQLARQDGRWIAFCGFSSTNQENWLVMKPDQWDNDKLIDWLVHFYSRYTDFEVLNNTAKKWAELDPPEGRTDVVFVTDGGDLLDDDSIKQWTEWRQSNNVRCYGINIDRPADNIEHLCDEAWSTEQMGLDDEPVKRILSEA